MNKNKLTKFDYISGGLFGLFCFVFFWHKDIWGVGIDSLNYLYGAPLDFYDNCYKLRVAEHASYSANYPPTTYLILAIWLYPAKLLGLIHNVLDLPFYFVYWLKLLTSIIYVASGLVFYKVALVYSDDKPWARFAAIAWMTTPLALFSQLIFSQYDICYVALSLVGFLMFLRGRLVTASLMFGLAITFKYFPAFIYLPLLLLFEKRILKLIPLFLVFAAPILVIHLLYGSSPAYVGGVDHFSAVSYIFCTHIDIAGIWQSYYLITLFVILCGFAYLAELSKEQMPRAAAYVYLVGSILPLLFTLWHPQWFIGCTPPLVLTTMLDRRWRKFLLFDLVGMVFFVGATVIIYSRNVDVGMFKSNYLLGLNLQGSVKMGDFFDIFPEHSSDVYLSGLWGYLLIHALAKYRTTLGQIAVADKITLDFNYIRSQFFLGLLIFVAPAILAVCLDYAGGFSMVNNEVSGFNFGELVKDRSFEQTFIARAPVMDRAELFLATYSRQNNGPVDLEVVDSNNKTLGKVEVPMESISDNSWVKFQFTPVPLIVGQTYKIRLTCPAGKPQNALTWWASPGDEFPDGTSIVDGTPHPSDFVFRIIFAQK